MVNIRHSCWTFSLTLSPPKLVKSESMNVYATSCLTFLSNVHPLNVKINFCSPAADKTSPRSDFYALSDNDYSSNVLLQKLKERNQQ